MSSLGPSEEAFCALCGLPFFIHIANFRSEVTEDDLVWLSYFLALRSSKTRTTSKVSEPNSGWFISGIGQQVWDETWEGCIPPPGYDIRDILKGRKPPPAGELRKLMSEDEREEWEKFDRVYAFVPGGPWNNSKDKSEDFLFPMHPCCWDILLQQHAIVAPPNQSSLDLNLLGNMFIKVPLERHGGGFKPDWSADYAGPEQFFWLEGEDNNDEFVGDLLEQAPEWKFLARDPGTAYGFDILLANPPLESAANMPSPIQCIDIGADIFSSLPNEILEDILSLLPSAAVRDVQLSSRRMASVHLGSNYWRSRFEFPNELCHIPLPLALLKSGKVGEEWVDWRRLCDQLLHPVGPEFGWWENRKRIIALNKKLVQKILHG